MTVIKAGQGDRSAQADLYRYYSKAMYNICIRMTGNPTDAQDIFQDAFIEAFRHLGHLKQPGAFAGWLRRIMINKCIQFSKNHVRWSSLDQDGMDPIADQEGAWWCVVADGSCREITAAFRPADTPPGKLAQILQDLNGLNGVLHVEVVENPHPIRQNF